MNILQYPLSAANAGNGVYMLTLEFKEMVEVSTPKGDGLIWYMMDYGPQSDTIYTIIIKETGECWQMTHKDFRVKMNNTLGIIKGYGKLSASTPPDSGAADS